MSRTNAWLIWSLLPVIAMTLVSCAPAPKPGAAVESSAKIMFVKGTTYFVCCSAADVVTDRGHDVTVLEYGPGPWIKIRVNEGRDQGIERWMNTDQVLSMRCR